MSMVMGVPTWRWPTIILTLFQCCWVMAMAPSSQLGASVRAAVLFTWPWATSMATGGPIWRSPTLVATLFQCCWATAMAPSSRHRALRRGELVFLSQWARLTADGKRAVWGRRVERGGGG